MRRWKDRQQAIVSLATMPALEVLDIDTVSQSTIDELKSIKPGLVVELERIERPFVIESTSRIRNRPCILIQQEYVQHLGPNDTIWKGVLNRIALFSADWRVLDA